MSIAKCDFLKIFSKFFQIKSVKIINRGVCGCGWVGGGEKRGRAVGKNI